MSKAFKCCFCGIEDIITDEQDIKDEEKYSNYVCIDCYIKMLFVIKEGQCDRIVKFRAEQIGGNYD